MNNLPIQQEQHRLNTIKSEISLAEKKRDEILLDLTRLDETKKSELKSHKNRIETIKKDIQTLSFEKNRLESECKNLSEVYVKKESEIRVYGTNEIKKAEETVQVICARAKKIQSVAEEKQRTVEEKSIVVDNRESSVKSREYSVNEKEIVYKKNFTELESKKIQIEQSKQSIDGYLSSVKVKIKEIEMTIAQKEKTILELNVVLERKEAAKKRIDDEMSTKMNEANRLMAMAESTNEANIKKSIELNRKEIWLNDRESAVGRAYREVVQRGGNHAG